MNPQTFRCCLFVTGERSVDYKPGRKGIRARFIKDQIILFGQNAEARGGEFDVDAAIQGAIRHFSVVGDSEALGIKCHCERFESIVQVFDFALRFFLSLTNNIFVDEWAHCLCRDRQSAEQKTSCLEKISPGAMSRK